VNVSHTFLETEDYITCEEPLDKGILSLKIETGTIWEVAILAMRLPVFVGAVTVTTITGGDLVAVDVVVLTVVVDVAFVAENLKTIIL
jgi:hypothetical protein